jgi:hypothetical protein
MFSNKTKENSQLKSVNFRFTLGTSLLFLNTFKKSQPVSKAMPSSVENSSTHIVNAIDIINFIEKTDLFKSVFK